MAFFRIGTLITEAEQLPKPYEVFRIEKNELTDEDRADALTIVKSDEPHGKDGLRLAGEHPLIKIWSRPDGGWIFENLQNQGTLAVSPDYRRGEFWAEDTDRTEAALEPLLHLMMECRLIDGGTVILHAACVEKDGVAVAFSGPSGAGKSTRASKWVEYLGAQWISGDRPAVHSDKGLVYGVPWDGKEQIFRNIVCPLHCIVEVRKASFTMTRRLAPMQAYRFLAKQILIPMWDPVLAAKAFQELKQITEKIPIYRQYSDKTAEAAKETCQALFITHKEQELERIKTNEEDINMKLKPEFEIVEIAGDYMAIPTGDNMASYGGSVVLNEVSAFLLKNMKESITRDELLQLLLNEYEVERETAETDIENILKTFQELGLIDEQ